MRSFIAVFKLFLFALNCLWVIPTQSLVLLITKGPAAYYLPQLWQKIACFIFGVRVRVHGEINKGHQTLFMSNHISYLDIPAMASVIRASFVAKSEVEGWALFGFLGSLQQTVYIQRQRSKIAKEKNVLLSRIENGDSLIIFPEGTSTSGFEVEPFKSSLFSLAMGDDKTDLYIQPITISVAQIDGQPPSNKEEQDIYAWPRDVDIELHHHLWRFAKTSGAIVDIRFHSALKASEFSDRKTLAKTCHERVSKGLEIAQAA